MTSENGGRRQSGSAAGDRTGRERILDACSELFTREGTRAVGVDTIIERANVAKATLYNNFPSKDALVVAWLREPETRWVLGVAEEVHRRANSPLGALVTLFDVLREWFEDGRLPGCPFLHTMSEFRDPEHPVRAEVRTFVNDVETWLRERAEAGGLPRPDDVAVRIRLLIAGCFEMSFATSSSAAWTDGRAAAVALLAEGIGTTREELEDRLASGPASEPSA